jgi:hypothetical protein
MATTEKLLTAEGFERLPDDGKRYELTVTTYQPGRDPTLLGEHGILEGDPVVPGFRCPVAEIFV